MNLNIPKSRGSELHRIEENSYIYICKGQMYQLEFEQGTDLGSNMYGKILAPTGFNVDVVLLATIPLEHLRDDDRECRILPDFSQLWAMRNIRRKNFLVQAQDLIERLCS